MIKKAILVVLTCFTMAGMSQAAVNLTVRVPDIVLDGATVGTEFQIPFYVQITGGTASQGLASMSARLLSTGSVNIIAPVTYNAGMNDQVTTSWETYTGSNLSGIDASLSDLDSDGDKDAKDSTYSCLGTATTKTVGVNSEVLVFTQTWKFVSQPEFNKPYTLDIAFSTTAGKYWNGTSKVLFGSQTGVDGSVTVVPEPMTLAMLAMGGLGLLRRKLA